jgi:hypothetical protein
MELATSDEALSACWIGLREAGSPIKPSVISFFLSLERRVSFQNETQTSKIKRLGSPKINQRAMRMCKKYGKV